VPAEPDGFRQGTGRRGAPREAVVRDARHAVGSRPERWRDVPR